MSPSGVVRAGGLSSRIYDVFDEVVTGLDGTARVFWLARKPIDGTVRLYRNGLRIARGVDYTVTGRRIELPLAPEADEIILADYSHR